MNDKFESPYPAEIHNFQILIKFFIYSTFTKNPLK